VTCEAPADRCPDGTTDAYVSWSRTRTFALANRPLRHAEEGDAQLVTADRRRWLVAAAGAQQHAYVRALRTLTLEQIRYVDCGRGHDHAHRETTAHRPGGRRGVGHQTIERRRGTQPRRR
jgi:hypothetical protein